MDAVVVIASVEEHYCTEENFGVKTFYFVVHEKEWYSVQFSSVEHDQSTGKLLFISSSTLASAATVILPLGAS